MAMSVLPSAGTSNPITGPSIFAAAMRNIEPNIHAFASSGIPASGLKPDLRGADLRPLMRFLCLGFLLKPVAFGGVVASIRLYVF